MPDGELFVDPDGHYELVIGTDWVREPNNPLPGAEFWYAGDDRAAGVNISSGEDRRPISDEHLDEILPNEENAASQGLENYELIDRSIESGHQGQQLGVVHYQATVGGVDLHFLTVLGQGEDYGVIAVLTAEPERFDEMRAAVEPYLLTLQTQ